MKVFRSLEEEFKLHSKQSVFDLRSEIIMAGHSSLVVGESKDILDQMMASKIKDAQAPNLVIECSGSGCERGGQGKGNSRIEFAECPLDPTISE